MKKSLLSLALSFILISLVACGGKCNQGCNGGSGACVVSNTQKTSSTKAEVKSDTNSEVKSSTGSTEAEVKQSSTKVEETLRLGGLKGPTTIGMVKLLADAGAKYDFTMGTMPDEIAPKLLKGELDIIAAPVNLGSVLYNKSGGKIRMLAINTLGVLYIGEKGDDGIKSVSDLNSKKIFATGKGATPEYVLTKVLGNAGVKADIEWKSEPMEVLAALKKSKSAIALLPQPFFTVAEKQVEGFKQVLDMTEEWSKIKDAGKLVTAGFFTTEKFIEAHKETVDAFLDAYKASSEWVNANVDEASKLVEAQGIVKAPIAKFAIPKCNVTYVDGEEMKSAVSGYLSVLAGLNNKAIGGKLPEDNFYYAK